MTYTEIEWITNNIGKPILLVFAALGFAMFIFGICSILKDLKEGDEA